MLCLWSCALLLTLAQGEQTSFVAGQDESIRSRDFAVSSHGRGIVDTAFTLTGNTWKSCSGSSFTVPFSGTEGSLTVKDGILMHKANCRKSQGYLAEAEQALPQRLEEVHMTFGVVQMSRNSWSSPLWVTIKNPDSGKYFRWCFNHRNWEDVCDVKLEVPTQSFYTRVFRLQEYVAKNGGGGNENLKLVLSIYADAASGTTIIKDLGYKLDGPTTTTTEGPTTTTTTTTPEPAHWVKGAVGDNCIIVCQKLTGTGCEGNQWPTKASDFKYLLENASDTSCASIEPGDWDVNPGQYADYDNACYWRYGESNAQAGVLSDPSRRCERSAGGVARFCPCTGPRLQTTHAPTTSTPPKYPTSTTTSPPQTTSEVPSTTKSASPAQRRRSGSRRRRKGKGGKGGLPGPPGNLPPGEGDVPPGEGDVPPALRRRRGKGGAARRRRKGARRRKHAEKM